MLVQMQAKVDIGLSVADGTARHRYDCAMVSGPDKRPPEPLILANLRCTCGASASVVDKAARERQVHGGGPSLRR